MKLCLYAQEILSPRKLRKNFMEILRNLQIFKIAQGKPKTSAKILDEKIILNVNYPLTIIREEEKSRIANFENEIPVRLGKIYNASSFIVSEHLKNTGEICMSCLLE